MHEDWKKMCRLCGKKNGSDIDIKLKLENTETLAVAITKYFGITISDKSDHYCPKICLLCHDTINSTIKFHIQAIKVNEMFLELDSSGNFDQSLNTDSFRDKYEVSNIEGESSFVSGSEPEEFDPLPVSTVLMLDSNCEESENITQIKNNLKLEITNEDEDLAQHGIFNNSNPSNEELLNEIIENTHPNKIGNKQKKLHANPNQTDKNVECNLCQKTFLTLKGRNIHLKQIHNVTIDPPTYKCKVCGKLFKRFQHLSSHEVVHLSEKERVSYDCPQCDKKFASEKYVGEHIRVVHKRDRPFICETCGSAFASSRNLVEHHLIHTDEKKFKCPKCEKTFKCKRALKLHIDIHDDTEYVCQICGLKLNTKQILRRHMLVHSDKRKYACNFCSREFKRPDAFKNHLILHTGLKPYKCSFCTLTFSNGSNCRNHKRIHHPLETANEESKGIKHTKNVPSIKHLKAVNEEVALENDYYGKRKSKNKSAARNQAQQNH